MDSIRNYMKREEEILYGRSRRGEISGLDEKFEYWGNSYWRREFSTFIIWTSIVGQRKRILYVAQPSNEKKQVFPSVFVKQSAFNLIFYTSTHESV